MTDELIRRATELAVAVPGCVEGSSPGDYLIGGVPVCSIVDARRQGGRLSLSCASPPGVPDEMVAAEPERFFHPVDAPGSGWIGVHLDGAGDDAVDWDEIAAILDDAVVAVTGVSAHPVVDESDGDDDDPAGVFRFTGRLWLHDGNTSWVFATVPPIVAARLDNVGGDDTKRGFGSRRVRVRIGSTTWATSIFPDGANSTYVLPVKKAVRKAEGVAEGDDVEIDLELEAFLDPDS